MAYEARGEKTVGMDPLQRPGQAARKRQQAHLDGPGEIAGSKGVAWRWYMAQLNLDALLGQSTDRLYNLQTARARQRQGFWKSVMQSHLDTAPAVNAAHEAHQNAQYTTASQ